MSTHNICFGVLVEKLENYFLIMHSYLESWFSPYYSQRKPPILLWVIDNKTGEHLIIYIKSPLFIIGNPSHEFVFIVFSDERYGLVAV